jgi:hypothetical protein
MNAGSFPAFRLHIRTELRRWGYEYVVVVLTGVKLYVYIPNDLYTRINVETSSSDILSEIMIRRRSSILEPNQE